MLLCSVLFSEHKRLMGSGSFPSLGNFYEDPHSKSSIVNVDDF
jgi:hypothetical protein